MLYEVITTIIQIRYNPTVPSYSNTHKELLMFQAGMDSNEIAIVGKSTRPIDPPAVYNAENITTGSFEAKWGTATNANGYYFTVYSIEDGTSEFSEGFDQRTQVPIGWMVKTDKWSESSVYSGKSIPAVQFSTRITSYNVCYTKLLRHPSLQKKTQSLKSILPFHRKFSQE